MKRLLPAALLLALAMPAWGASLKIPAEVKAQPGRWLVVSPETDCKAVSYVGLDGLEPFPSSELKDPRRLVLQAPAAAGRWRFVAVGCLDNELAEAAFTVVVGDVPPVPPGPGPVPPGPVPPGPVPPGPVAGMRVLIVEETADRTKLPAAQVNVLFAKSVRDYLDAHTPLMADGKTHEWGIFDADADLTAYGGRLQEMMKRKPDKGKLPWIILAGEKGVAYEGPLPANVADTLALLKKYAEGK